MARTKKKRNYKKAPKNTRVFRCVQKVKKKQELGAAIAICQSSTKQSYRTGKTLKKKGGAPKFLCGPDIDFVPAAHFARLESIFDKLKEDTTETPLEDIVDKLPSIRKDKGECYNCKKLIDKLVENTMPPGPRILPIENDDIIWLQQFTGVHKGGMCTIMGGRRKKKTRKKRGGNNVITDEMRTRWAAHLTHDAQIEDAWENLLPIDWTNEELLETMLGEWQMLNAKKHKIYKEQKKLADDGNQEATTLAEETLSRIRAIQWIIKYLVEDIETLVDRDADPSRAGGGKRRNKKTRKKRGGKTTILGFPIPIFDLWQTKVKVNNTKTEVEQWKKFIEKKTSGGRRKKGTRRR